MTGPCDQLTDLGEERPAGARRVDQRVVVLLMFPSTLALMTPRGRIRSCVVPKPLPVKPVGSGSTEAEKIELITLPAIRTCMVPPFWAIGSMLAGEGVDLGVGDRRRRLAEEDAVAGRERRWSEASWRT